MFHHQAAPKKRRTPRRVSARLALGLGVLLAMACRSSAAVKNQKAAAKSPVTFEKNVAPLLDQYCFSCHGNGKHKGDVILDQYRDEASGLADVKLWTKVREKVQNGEMPPEKKPQPTPRERELLLRWIEEKVFKCDCDHPDPGRVTIRRLNRVEYNNTVRDLIGINFQPADDFPVDDSGYGFDNIGDALSLPPVLIEKYLGAAQKILDEALVLDPKGLSQVKKYPVDLLELGYNAKQKGDGWVSLNTIEEDDVAVDYLVRAPGEYLLRARAYARQDGAAPMKLTFMVDGKPAQAVEVTTNSAAPEIYETRIEVPAGHARFRAVARRLKEGLSEAEALKWKTGQNQKGSIFVQYLEIEGPLNPATERLPLTHRRIFKIKPAPGAEKEAAREILSMFAKRAYRRPVLPAEIGRLMVLVEGGWKDGDTFEQGVGLALQAILVSPHFLFRGELQAEPDNPAAIQPVNEFALASRLSYFLWSTMPDEELFSQAERGTLRRNLAGEVRRMLNDPKARALVDNFAGQWLQIRNLKLVAPDPWLFPEFDEELRAGMQRETELFVEYIIRGDRNVLEFVDADYSFLNERLARHYGIANVEGNQFRYVSLRGTVRGGLLGQASILTLTSNPTRSSPVKRGKWVLDNILGTPPPPPPPEVPELSEAKEVVLSGTLRQRMEQHRADPGCASCHARMDPIGFGMENFNAIGGWRNQDGKFSIDPAGKLVSGESFSGLKDLKKIIAEGKKEQFLRCLSEKTVTYALGRGLEFYDKCALDQIVKGMGKNNYHFSSLILEVAKSTPFQMRRGDAASRVTQLGQASSGGN